MSTGRQITETIRIDWKPDKQAQEPLYIQIVNYFSKKIFAGDRVDGQTLPSQRRLSALLSMKAEQTYPGGKRVY